MKSCFNYETLKKRTYEPICREKIQENNGVYLFRINLNLSIRYFLKSWIFYFLFTYLNDSYLSDLLKMIIKKITNIYIYNECISGLIL
jgi:hypothetical protein